MKQVPLVLLIAVAFVALLLAASLQGFAMVSPLVSGVERPIKPHEVCQLQGFDFAGTFKPWNPYSWFCYDGPIPFGAHDMQVQPWCLEEYSTSAHLFENDPTVFDWGCLMN